MRVEEILDLPSPEIAFDIDTDTRAPATQRWESRKHQIFMTNLFTTVLAFFSLFACYFPIEAATETLKHKTQSKGAKYIISFS